MASPNADKLLSKAKIGLLTARDAVFFSTILLSLKTKWDDSIPTAAVDGTTMFINKEFFIGLTEPERLFLMFHETCHVAYMHMCRLGTRDHKVFNMAADYVINQMAVDRGFHMIKGGLIDKKYRGMSTEQVYDHLIQNPEQQPQHVEQDIVYGDGSSDSAKAAEQKITQILAKAVMQSKMAGEKPGSVPGDIEMALDEILNPKLPWYTLLQNYLSSFCKEDYSYKRPNRRFLEEFYLPSLHSEGLGKIAVAVDTSGSVTQEDFASYRAELNYIKETMNPSGMTIVSFDTQIQNVHELEEDQSVLDCTFTGRGGTSLTPVFEYFNENPPQVLIIFSDLYCRQIEEEPEYPVIWICVGNPNAQVNFGELIHFETNL